MKKLEFKGTSGEWMNTNGYIVWCKVGNNIKTIADCENRTLKGNQEQYNALLISKAPEMLEMLQSLENDNNAIPKMMWDKIQKLIESATKID